ncbi:MFS transporter [Gordonia sp. NB41Y]|uniref:MFS transporter n=1 Tax=Gordonia sp. NB41Y TaxID=875808 RepID=UPI0006B1F93D|nr:MFS transporter [Gordonia sp. NB41Y]EMP11602.2 MFS transporter [Gordonia sp. NB41Y]WLP88863.1 MFS transporter [Gordonia sp. NB41Y]
MSSTASSTTVLPKALRPFVGGQYRLLAAGLVFALFSDGVWTIALVWQVIALGGGPAQVSIATGVAAIGMVVSTLAGGVLADRVSQRRIIIGLEVVKTLAFVSVGVCALVGVLSLPIVVLAALFGGITTGMYYPAYSALLPSIVTPSELQAANGIEGFLRPVLFQAVGPMVAGAVIAAAAPAQAIVVAAIASVAAGVCYLAMRPVPLRRDVTTLRGNAFRSIVTDMAEGFVYMWRTPWLWSTLFFATILVLATMGPIEVLIPFALRERVHGGAGDHALVLAGFGVGAAISSLVFASIPMPRRYLSVMFAVWGFSSVPLVLMGIAGHTWVFIVAAFVTGVLFDGPMVLWGTLLQRRVPPALLGRVASLDFFVSAVLMPVSMALAAPLAHAIGLQATFIVCGLLPVPFALCFYLAARLWRDEVDHPLVDDEPHLTAVPAPAD